MLNISLLGSIFYILFKILEKLSKNNLTSNFYYKLSKIIALFFIIPISYILSFYLPDFNNINFYKTELIQQTITENKDFIPINNNTNNIINETQNIITNTSNETTNINNQQKINSNIDKTNINYNIILEITYILGLILVIFFNFLFFLKFKTTINKSKIILDENYNNILIKVKNRLNINKNILIFENKDIFSPMLVGILNPKIILPKKDISLQDLEFILTHELIHFKRKDLITKLILLFINIINYFNPLIYFMIKDIDKWCEYSCDERLIKIYNNNQKNYCLAILNAINPNKNNNIYFSTTFACNKNNLKRRFENIMSENKPKNKLKVTLICSFFILICTIFIVAFSLDYSNNINALDKTNFVRTFDEPVEIDIYNKHITTEILPEEKEKQLIPKVVLKGTFKKEEPSIGPILLDFNLSPTFKNDTKESVPKYIKIDLENIAVHKSDANNILDLYCTIEYGYTTSGEKIFLGKFNVPKGEKRTYVFETIPEILFYDLRFQHPNSHAPSFNLEVTTGYTLESLGVDSISQPYFEETIPLTYEKDSEIYKIRKDKKSFYNNEEEGSGIRTYKLTSGFYNNLNLKLENKSNDEYSLFIYDKSFDVSKNLSFEDFNNDTLLYKEYTIPPNTILDESLTNTLVKTYGIQIVPTELKDDYLELNKISKKISDIMNKESEELEDNNEKEALKLEQKYEEYSNEYNSKYNSFCEKYEKYLTNQKGNITYKFTN